MVVPSAGWCRPLFSLVPNPDYVHATNFKGGKCTNYRIKKKPQEAALEFVLQVDHRFSIVFAGSPSYLGSGLPNFLPNTTK